MFYEVTPSVSIYGLMRHLGCPKKLSLCVMQKGCIHNQSFKQHSGMVLQKKKKKSGFKWITETQERESWFSDNLKNMVQKPIYSRPYLIATNDYNLKS